MCWALLNTSGTPGADPLQATNAFELSGRIAMSSGCWQAGIVLRTFKLFASIKDTVLSPRLLTTTVVPSGETLANPGETPTRTLPITARCSRSIADTLFEPEFAT